jgi:chorismate mutase
MQTYCRGIRGAVIAPENSREAILAATRELLEALIAANDLQIDDIASAIFTTTPDLTAEFPAVAARELGWIDTALMCGHEMTVPGSMQRVVRVLIHWNTARPASEVVHVYLGAAAALRPERAHARDAARLPNPSATG